MGVGIVVAVAVDAVVDAGVGVVVGLTIIWSRVMIIVTMYCDSVFASWYVLAFRVSVF